jgi:UDP-sugar transporter A1/2/3
MTEAALFGINLKWITLATLVVQNSSLALVMHHSQQGSGPRFNPATAVILAELLKLCICVFVQWKDRSKLGKYGIRGLLDDVVGRDSNHTAMAVPALLYFIQNNLQYTGAKLLDAAVYQVSCQFKIITTAMFAVWMLQRKLSVTKWTGLGFLTVGIALVNVSLDHSEKQSNSIVEQFGGLIAIAIATVLSGLAGIWFEKVLKGSQQSVILRNIQLSLFSCMTGILMGLNPTNRNFISTYGFFYGYNALTWLAILLQALGGLIVAYVVKYADNILKGFATSISIIVTSLISVFFLGGALNGIFLIGVSTVIYGRFRSSSYLFVQYRRQETRNYLC